MSSTIISNSGYRKAKVIVGLSGGVDSSVSAYILKEMGYEVQGLFMKNWDEDDGTEYCTAMTDFEDALRVAHALDIECISVSFSREYWDRVFQHFLTEYQSGRTPNPDILCNKEIKFKAFLEHAQSLGADYIATGHYAQKVKFNGKSALFKGSDTSKDQSYFLHAVSEKALAKTLFPIGGLLKREVRRIAKENNLVTHDKKDSTGICFIGERKFRDFLKTYIPAKPGNIVTENGRIIGKHQGLMFYTIGQRQGLGIGGLKDSSEAPWYVIEKNTSTNELMVGQGADNPLLFRQRLVAHNLNWIDGSIVETKQNLPVTIECSAKTRYRQPDQSCSLLVSGNEAQVEFVSPQRAITPGQSIVFYDGLHCLGGGIIGANQAEAFTSQ